MLFTKNMMNRFYLLATLLSLSCQSNDDPNPHNPPVQPPPPVSIVSTNNSDLIPDYTFGRDQRVNGNFYFEAGYFVDEATYQFTTEPSFYMASYEGELIRTSQVYDQLMCVNSHNDCNNSEWPASSWDRIGRLPTTDTLRWEYTTEEQDQRYRFEMTDLPQTIEVLQVPPVLSTEQDQIITFKELPDEDILALELVTISKSELNRQLDIPFVNHGRVFFARLVQEPGQVTVSRDEIVKLQENRIYPTAEDTTFWNVASIRKVIKNVDGKNIQLTYQQNHLIPVQVE